MIWSMGRILSLGGLELNLMLTLEEAKKAIPLGGYLRYDILDGQTDFLSEKISFELEKHSLRLGWRSPELDLNE